MLYSLDTCTLILFFKGNESVCKNVVKKRKDNKLIIPPMSYYEILRGFLNANATSKIQKLKFMYQNAYEVIKIPENEVYEKAAEIFVELKKKGFTVGTPDIIIAAWSILTGATLVTDNTKDFINIDGLQIENWKER
jgi:tRNA(fMet)-specific endonuclease VapC